MIYGEFLITHLLLIETNNSKNIKNYYFFIFMFDILLYESFN